MKRGLFGIFKSRTYLTAIKPLTWREACAWQPTILTACQPLLAVEALG